jgi:hypothetical protein
VSGPTLGQFANEAFDRGDFEPLGRPSADSEWYRMEQHPEREVLVSRYRPAAGSNKGRSVFLDLRGEPVRFCRRTGRVVVLSRCRSGATDVVAR